MDLRGSAPQSPVDLNALPAAEETSPSSPAASDTFTLEPPVSEVLKMRRLPAGEMPPAERAPALREAALRASRAPAVEIIARLSSERTKLKGELAQAQRDREEALRELAPLREKLAAYEKTTEGFALSGPEETGTAALPPDALDLIDSLRAELAARDAERAEKDAAHEELARRAVEQLRAERAALAAREEELATLRADIESREGELTTFRSDLDGYDAQFDALRSETHALRHRNEALKDEVEALGAQLAARDEILRTRERIDAEARETDAQAYHAQNAQLAEQAAQLEAQSAQLAEQAAQLEAQNAQIAEQAAQLGAQASLFETQTAQLAEQAALIEALRVELDAELGRRAAMFAEHAEEKDELDRLRRHAADLEQEGVRAGALEADLHAATAALESRAAEVASLEEKVIAFEARAHEADALRERLAQVEKERAELRALAEAKPSPALESREERAARASRALAIGFGNASVLGGLTAPRKPARRFDDLGAHARPYPALDAKNGRSAARVEKALRRVDRRLARLERMGLKVAAAPIAVATPAPAPAPAAKPKATSMFGKTPGSGGMLGALIQANLALRASATNTNDQNT